MSTWPFFTSVPLCGKLISVLMFLSFFKIGNKGRSEEKSSYYPGYVHQIHAQVASIIRKKYQLNCCAAGGGMPYDVQSIDMYFERKKPATVDEARVLMIEVLDVFREVVNQHEDVRPFLREYPFPISRLNINIGFNSRYAGEKEAQSVDFACISKPLPDQTGISYNQLGVQVGNLVELLEETYEEALKRYNASKQEGG